LQQLQWKVVGGRGFKYNGNKKQAGNLLRLSGMEENLLEVKVHSGRQCLRRRRRRKVINL
jgi:hypothetical protein